MVPAPFRRGTGIASDANTALWRRYCGADGSADRPYQVYFSPAFNHTRPIVTVPRPQPGDIPMNPRIQRLTCPKLFRPKQFLLIGTPLISIKEIDSKWRYQSPEQRPGDEQILS